MEQDAQDQRRAWQRLNEDGLLDLFLGIWLCASAGYLGLMRFAGPGFIGLVGVLPLIVSIGLPAARRTFTYPRIGNIRLELLGLVVMLLVSRTGLTVTARMVHGTVFVVGLAGAAGLAWVGRRGGLVRYYVYAAVLVLTAAGILLRGYELFDRLVLGTAVPGAVMLVTGALIFSQFLRRYPLDGSDRPPSEP
jgi:hypothetical protein